MAINLSQLAAATTGATALSNLILVTPQEDSGYQPQNPPNADGTPSTAEAPPGILFHYEGEQTVTLESDITDHYVEDNTAIQDQIALKPEKVTTHGYIGELNDVAPKLLKPLKTAAEKLTVIGAYTPVLSLTALIAYNGATLAYQVASNAVNAAVSAWSSLTGGSANQTKQQIAFAQFYGYWQKRTLFTIQTPWMKLENMAIMTLRAIQDESTRMITDFEVTFKVIRTAKTATASSTQALLESRAGMQAAGLVNLGTSSVRPSIPLSSGLTTMGVA